MKKKVLLLSALFLFVIIGFWAFDTRIAVRRYTVHSPKIVPGTEVTLALLTDLHSTFHGENQETLMKKLQKEQPDIVLLGGDIADDVMPIAGTKSLLQQLSLTGIPSFYVTGNHEYWSGEIDSILALFEQYHVRVLRDEILPVTVGDNTLLLCGVNDPEARQYSSGAKNEAQLTELFAAKDSSLFSILLAHRPERYEQYQSYGVDLTLNGHAHGGQVRIPLLLNGLYAPDQGFFPPYAGGEYHHGGMTQIVSRGLSIARIPRIFNPPELCIIKLLPE